MELPDEVFIDARDRGDTVTQNRIIKQFLGACNSRYGKRPDGYVSWGDRRFDIKRVAVVAQAQSRRPMATHTDVECPCDFDSCELCNRGDHYICRACPRAA